MILMKPLSYPKNWLTSRLSLGIIQDNPEEYFTDGIALTDQEVNVYITRRNQARAEKDFQLSDNIRDELSGKRYCP